MTGKRPTIALKQKFQSTHLHEVWQLCVKIHDKKRRFNPHTYMRCDKRVLNKRFLPNRFNPHTYMRCDNTFRELKWHMYLFQSTHLHEVWLLVSFFYLNFGCFNPHTYMRCDYDSDIFNNWIKKVSIHTPTWGVTTWRNRLSRPNTSFNPHTYMRCDLRKTGSAVVWMMFQSTHLHEVWPQIIVEQLANMSFNPHTYMRCDRGQRGQVGKRIVSIHTPTWGVTEPLPFAFSCI